MVFNPLSVRLWEDAITVGLAYLADTLVLVSNYTVIVGGTLMLVAVILYIDGRSKKETKKFKKLKSSKTNKAGEYLG